MPYRWSERPGEPAVLTVTPHRALGPRGFVAIIGATVLLLAIPVIEALGTAILWVMLAFCGAAVAGLWVALRRNDRDRQVREVLTLGPESVTLERTEARGARRVWQANPHWVRVTLYPTGQKVADYLTLSGAGREVEIGALLTPEERRALAADLRARLAGRPAP